MPRIITFADVPMQHLLIENDAKHEIDTPRITRMFKKRDAKAHDMKEDQ